MTGNQPTDTVTGRLDRIEDALTANTEILADLADTITTLAADTRLSRVEQSLDGLLRLIGTAVAEEMHPAGKGGGHPTLPE
jgi:hypothetical protein